MKKVLYAIFFSCLLCALTAGCGDTQKGAEGVDVDLSVLNDTMVSARLYSILSAPGDYVGKTIKISGVYSASFYDETGLIYHYVITKDGDNCCREGLEFIWNGGDTYPEEKAKIEAVGTFGSYEELGYVYYYLAVDELVVL